MTDHGGGLFLDIQRHIDETFEKLIYRRWAIPNPAGWIPRLDLHETRDGFLIEVDLPGVPPDQVEIRVTEGALTIAGTRPATALEGALQSQRERECGTFCRLVSLPQAVTPEQARAEYRHGTYQIHLGSCLHLVLRPDVIQAVAQGRFHIWAVDTIDEGIELLPGMPAGDLDQDGTFHHRLDQRLKETLDLLEQQPATGVAPRAAHRRSRVTPAVTAAAARRGELMPGSPSRSTQRCRSRTSKSESPDVARQHRELTLVAAHLTTDQKSLLSESLRSLATGNSISAMGALRCWIGGAFMPRETIVKSERDWAVAPNLRSDEKARAEFCWSAARSELEGLPGGAGLNIAHEAVDRHAAGSRASHLALRCIGKTGEVHDYSYAELRNATNRFANVLVRLGVFKGDRVFVMAGRIPELYVAALGTLKNRSLFCPPFSAFGPEPIRARMAIGEAKVLVTTETLYRRKVERIRSSLPSLEDVLVVRDREVPGPCPEQTQDLRDLMEHASDQFVIGPTDPTDMALLHFTSGTTGTPRGAVHVHEAVVAHHATGKIALDLHPSDRFWCTADPGWVTGTSDGIIAPLANGITSIVDEAEFDAERWYRILQDQRVTVWYSAPTAIRMMMRAGVELVSRLALGLTAPPPDVQVPSFDRAGAADGWHERRSASPSRGDLRRRQILQRAGSGCHRD